MLKLKAEDQQGQDEIQTGLANDRRDAKTITWMSKTL